jgi:tetratricopeptide (TPR) repeat protein
MEIGLTGHLPLPTLPQEKPAPLHHLLERLKRTSDGPPLARLRATLDCLEFLERYFAGHASGLVRKLQDGSELNTLASNAGTSPGLRRLFRYAINRLEAHNATPGVRDLLACFFLHGKRSLPFSHARWLGLISNAEPNGEPGGWSYEGHFENLASQGHEAAINEAVRQAMDVLQSWLEGAMPFFETHQHFARLDVAGWQCTVQKGDSFVELVPPIPARLIPVEAQAPTAAPQTEDESTLFAQEPSFPENVSPYEENGPARTTRALEASSVEPPPSVDASKSSAVAVDSPDGGPSDSRDEGQSSQSQREDDDLHDGETVEARIDLEALQSQLEAAELPIPARPGPLSSSPPSDAVSLPRWSAAELKSFETSLRQIYPRLDPERVPREYFHTLSRFLSSVSSGYIIVEGRQGTGKTTLSHAYRDYLLESSLDAVPLLFSVKNQFYPDPTTFLEQLNEHLRIRPGLAGQRAFEALDPQVIKNLNLRTAADNRPQRFSSFLSELRLVNGTRMVLILDGLDEGTTSPGQTDSLFSYLPASLPEGVYIVVSYHPDRCRPGDREVLQEIREAASTEVVLSAGAAHYRDLMERFLNRDSHGPLTESLQEVLLEKSGGRLATAQHMLDGLRCQLFENEDDLPPADQIYERLFDRLYARVPDRYLDLFLLLATSDEPVSGEELSALGISRTDVLELVHSLPSLFHCYQERMVGLNLAHRAIRLHLQRTFLTSYAQSCLRLAQRAMHRLSETEITILPVREDLDRLGEGVRRLLRWAYDSNDSEFLAAVSGHETLGKLRRRIFAAMEERALHHRKAMILDTFARGLEKLVLQEQREQFREELAWSHSSRALSYYHLGHYQRALQDIETAISHFQNLVEEQGQEALRNGLAAALNRRSEIYRGLLDWQRAYPDAERAVQNYQQVVGPGGRTDLTALLMLAYHNRGIVHRALRQLEQADQDLDAALTGYLRLVDRENRRDLRPQLAAVYQTRASLALDRGDADLALSSASAALELYETLVHQENFESLRNELASVYNDRGAILSRAGILDEAERDYASAVSIRTYLVAEGRIDVRTDLAKTYSNRGLCLIPLGDYEGARESFDRAVEILDRLIEEERREDLYSDRAFALNCRGSLARQTGDLMGAREDFTSAAGDYRLAVISQGDKHLEDLGHILNSLAEVSLATGDTAVARRSCERALEIYEKRVLPQRRQALGRERAIAHHNFGETLRHEGNEAEAEKEYQQAIDLLTHEVEQMGRPQLTGELATSLLRFAQLSRQTPESVLRLVSRALAFFQGAHDEEDERLASLVDEALLLRASAYKKLNSLGAALDDVSRVVGRLEDSLWSDEAGLHSALVNALLERSALFAALNDKEAALLDLDRAWEIVEEREQADGGPEAELRRCHILFERIRMQTASSDLDFGKTVALLLELDTRLTNVPLEQLAAKDFRALRRRAVNTFKDLRLAALGPTREGDYQTGVDRLTQLLQLASQLRPNFSSLLQTDPGSSGEFDPVTRLRTQRAWTLVKLGQLEDALADFEAVVVGLPAVQPETSPDTLEFIAEVESGRGAVLDSLQRSEEALKAYSRAVDAFARRPESLLSPRRAACLDNRARLLGKLKKHQEALKDIEPAIEIARSNYQKADLMSRWAYKAELHRQAGDALASLATYREALTFGQRDGDLDAGMELPLRLGLFRLSEEQTEREESLRRVLALLKEQLASRSGRWRAEATRLFCELPYPSDDAAGLALEKEICEAVEGLLQVTPVGHSVMTETLLRRGARLFEMKNEARAFRKLAAAQYCLATKFCLLEYRKYGNASLQRLLRCYLLTGRSLVDAEAPPQLAGMGAGFKEIAQAIYQEPPDSTLEVELNNMARLWLSLPPSKVLQAGVSRATLQKLRRW